MNRSRLKPLCMVFVLVLAGCSSGGSDDHTTSVSILAPTRDALVSGKDLTVRLRADGPGFRAVLDGHDVSRRFRAGADGLRTATFRRGRDFAIGRDSLTAEVGEAGSTSHEIDSTVFRAARRDDSRVRVSHRRQGAAVALRVRSSQRIVDQRVSVNGSPYREEIRAQRDGRGFSPRLGPRHGLRYGANRVSTEVEHGDGVVSRSTRTVAVARDQPLTDAGPDRVTARGGAVVLDGSATKAPQDGDRLHYRWRLESAPEGSKAELDSATTRTSFRPDVPGRYRLALAAATQGEDRAVDAVQVDARPTDDPMGVPVETITRQQGIQVGGTTYPRKGGWVRLLVLDPVTLLPVPGGDQGFDLADVDTTKKLDKLNAAIDADAVQDDDVVILSGQGIDQPKGVLPAANATALEKAFARLGGTTSKRGPTFRAGASFDRGSWSLIGRKGLSSGEAWQNYLVQQAGIPGSFGADGGRPGTLNGYLQVVGTESYEFVSPEYVSLDTKAPGATATKNVVSVGAKSYASDDLGGGRASGFQLLALDSSDLSLGTNETYRTRTPDGQPAVDAIGALAKRLDGLIEDPLAGKSADARSKPPLIVLQSFGEENNAGLWSVGNHSAWVQDSIPGWSAHEHDDGVYDFFNWCGGSKATGQLKDDDDGKVLASKCTGYPHSVGGLGSTPTVTRSVGLIAGLPARTAVANIGRKGAAESMTLVGSPHPYNDGQVTVQVGQRTGRLVTTLRRTKQSHWRAAAPAPTGDFDTASFWQTAFRPKQPWTYAPSDSAAMGAAHKIVVGALWPRDARCAPNDACVTDVRDEYVPHISDDWDSYRDLLSDTDPPDDAGPDVQAAYTKLQRQLRREFDYLGQIQNLFDNYKTLFRDAQTNGLLDMEKIGNDVKSQALKDSAAFEAEQAELDAHAPVGNALNVAANLLKIFEGGAQFGGPVALFASAWDLYTTISESNKKKKVIPHPPDYPQLIVDRADQLGVDLVTQYQDLNDTLDHLLAVFVSDPGKLNDAYANTTSVWGLEAGSDQQKLLVQSIATSAQAAFYSALMPIAYDQFFISPVQTQTGNENQKDVTKAGPRDYNCDEGPNPFEATSVPDSSLHYVRWEQSGGRDENYSGKQSDGQVLNRNHSIGRGLKSKSNPLTTNASGSSRGYGSGLAQYPDTKKAGASPPAQLTDKLFKAPSRASLPQEPDGLGMSKDLFFGMSAWTAPRLQCGPSSDRDYTNK